MQRPGPGAVLLAVDLQRGFADPSWGVRNNPDLERNVERLLASWRMAGEPVVHVRHDSRTPGSTLAPGHPGNAPMACAAEQAGEHVVAKSVHSAFVGTMLPDVLVSLGATELVLCGIQTNYCVATTARMAGNLGYRTWVVGDACATFGQKDRGGRSWTAQELHDVALMELDGEFARVVETRDIVPLAVRRA